MRKAPQIAFRECIARRSCQGGPLFAALTPRITHGARILPFLGASFGCCGWGGGGVGRGGGCRLAPAACAPPPRFVRGVAIGPTYPRGLPRHPAPVRGVAVISGCSFELSPPTRTMFLLPLLPSRETCPLPPPPSEARTFRGALCEVSAFASRRWVCPSPSTRRLCLVRPFRGGACC